MLRPRWDVNNEKGSWPLVKSTTFLNRTCWVWRCRTPRLGGCVTPGLCYHPLHPRLGSTQGFGDKKGDVKVNWGLGRGAGPASCSRLCNKGCQDQQGRGSYVLWSGYLDECELWWLGQVNSPDLDDTRPPCAESGPRHSRPAPSAIEQDLGVRARSRSCPK